MNETRQTDTGHRATPGRRRVAAGCCSSRHAPRPPAPCRAAVPSSGSYCGIDHNDRASGHPSFARQPWLRIDGRAFPPKAALWPFSAHSQIFLYLQTPRRPHREPLMESASEVDLETGGVIVHVPRCLYPKLVDLAGHGHRIGKELLVPEQVAVDTMKGLVEASATALPAVVYPTLTNPRSSSDVPLRLTVSLCATVSVNVCVRPVP